MIEEQSFSSQRKQQQITEEASVDGIYAIRSSVTADRLDAAQLVHSYKRLAQVARALRTLKSMVIHWCRQQRPIRHHLENRVRAYSLLGMVAYRVRWHLERPWRPRLFGDEQSRARQAPIAPGQRSQPAVDKARTQRLAGGTPVHDFSTLLEELSTLSRQTIRMTAAEATFDKLTTPTPLQQQAFSLLGIPITLASQSRLLAAADHLNSSSPGNFGLTNTGALAKWGAGRLPGCKRPSRVPGQEAYPRPVAAPLHYYAVRGRISTVLARSSRTAPLEAARRCRPSPAWTPVARCDLA